MRFYKFTSLRKKVYAILCSTLLCILFCSCENFLTGAPIREELEQLIAYYNAKIVNVKLSCPEYTGTFIPDNSYEARLGFAFELQFIPNTKNCQVINPAKLLKAVSRKDASISLDDYVEFVPVEQSQTDKNDGLFRIRVKVIKDSEDIVIVPSDEGCVVIPVIEEITPPYSSAGVGQDSPIKIVFNKPVDPQSFGDFSCISINCLNEDLKDSFEQPVFSSDNKALLIYPKSEKLFIDPDSGNKKDITVSFDFTLVKDADGVTITAHEPHTYKINDSFDTYIEYAYVNITGTNGKFSREKKEYKSIKGYARPLGYDPDAEYEFICWQVFDETTDTEIPNERYIKIENPAFVNTNYTLISIPSDTSIKLAIKPVVAERPQILSCSPSDVNEGSWSDTTIQAVFDYPMDIDSILYTGPEMQVLTDAGITSFIPSPDYPERNCGYKQVIDGIEQVFYKNIKIQDKNSGENLAMFYGEPRFSDSSTLYIPVVDSSKLINGINVVVIFDKNFCYRVKYDKIDKTVNMSSSKKMYYLTNGKTDSTPPGYTIKSFSIASTNITDSDVSDSDGKTYGQTQPQIKEDGPKVAALFESKFIKAAKISLSINELKVTDSGSNPSPSFKVLYKKIYDSDYNAVSENELITNSKEIFYDNVNGATATYSGTVELTGLKDGVYEIRLELKDRGGAVVNYPKQNGYAFYVSKDMTAPPISNIKFKYTNATTIKMVCDVKDLVSYQINYTTNDGTTGNVALTAADPTMTVNSQQNYYNLTVSATDAAGNTSSTVSRKTFPKAMSTSWDKGFIEVNGTTVTQKREGSKNFTGEPVTIPDLIVGEQEVISNIIAYKKQYNFEDDVNADYPYNVSMGGISSDIVTSPPLRNLTVEDAIIYCNLRSIVEGLDPVYSYDGKTDPKDWDYYVYYDSRNIYYDSGIYREEHKYCASHSSGLIYNDKFACDNSKNGYRLPTLAEWEYIATAENTENYLYSGSDSIDEVAWYTENCRDSFNEYTFFYSKLKKPNSLGVYYMSGNLAEWCFEPNKENRSWICGGGSTDFAEYCTVYSQFPAGNRYKDYGLRVVRTAYPQN